ncbi:hypothetical protein BMW23_1083 [Bodo saltans virus]|uniref:Uncharacterized protein n=1 Tax=Bodo saltans virus TaxID=2024608 RepID=A0A2H4UW57_9VIRU|nr:hypothetical protein QJ851_gp1064 [Bodo saltans virus]ATZ81127.1 hypothetical protein BMW23_1083 [Bodo saltans virus]
MKQLYKKKSSPSQLQPPQSEVEKNAPITLSLPLWQIQPYQSEVKKNAQLANNCDYDYKNEYVEYVIDKENIRGKLYDGDSSLGMLSFLRAYDKTGCEKKPKTRNEKSRNLISEI